MRKSFLIFVLVMMIALAISVGSFAEEVTLRFLWWGGQDRAERTTKVIELFEEKYPNVKIAPEYVNFSDYFKKLAVQATTRDLPDIMQQNVAHIIIYAEKGLLLNLNPYVEDNRLNLTDASEMEISGAKINGNLYGINLGSNAKSFVYDPELFKKAGVEEPTPDWTWEDYIEKAKKIHDALGIYADDPHILNVATEEMFNYYLRQHGQDLFDKSGKKLGYEDDKFFVDYYTMFIDLAKDGVIAPIQISNEITHGAYGEYLISKQKAAGTWFSSNQVVALSEAAGRPLNLAIFPNAKDQVKYATVVRSSQEFAVAGNSKHPEWAVKFIDFFTNDLEANKILAAERGIPISSKVRDGLKPYLNDAQKETFDFLELAIKYSSPFDCIFPPNYNQIKDLIKITYEKMFYEYDEFTPEEAAKEFREKANKILAE